MTARPWHNRIVRYGEEAPDQLLANPRNWRIHPATQTDALAGVLREVGIVQNVLVNERSGFVIDGHARIALALREGQPAIPVTYVDLSDEEEYEILATLDPLAALAGTDSAKLEALLAEVSSGEAAVQQMLAELAFDVELQAIQSESEAADRQFTKKASAVTAVFSVQQLALVEQAVRAVGNPNRGEAFVTICEYYLAER